MQIVLRCIGLKCSPMFVFAGNDPDPRLSGNEVNLNLAIEHWFKCSLLTLLS